MCKNNTIKAGGSTVRAQSKMSEWVSGVEWMDTPQTVMTTRAPTVLKSEKTFITDYQFGHPIPGHFKFHRVFLTGHLYFLW